EYKPTKHRNKKPIVLVGKGIVFDTGGLSLKPTTNSMDMMKCDMSGAATAGAVLYAVAKSKLPLHILALVPATDNRPGEKAYAPGDVIRMMDGSTVEVLNSDAEGRMILADALHYAKKYKPELVIDIATLTGSALRALGHFATAYMGTAPDSIKKQIIQSSLDTYERLWEFPLWEEYGTLLQSDIADQKNIGGELAGMITAGKFLEKFIDYPWLHLDIAGTAFLTSESDYKGKGGTGVGVRLLYHFLKNYQS
ncbi:MAG: M17 family metallopeptidase, partial [Chitinophagales bacterium]|nr:M17 family metallopeptidase [Chitinophagales bacterium]